MTKRGGTLGPGLSLDDFLPYLLNRITNSLNRDLREDFRRIGITVPRWRVLAVLKDRDGRSIGDLAIYTVIEQPTLSRVIDQMERDGLVERRTGAVDSRVVEVHLTPRGTELYATLAPLALRHYRRAVAGMDDESRRELVRLLRHLLGNVNHPANASVTPPPRTPRQAPVSRRRAPARSTKKTGR
jgi:MarR family transcriptional regulator, organic hydroperoxide resistance regulator